MKSTRSNSQLKLLNDELEKSAAAGDVDLTLRLISQGADMQIAMQEAGYAGQRTLINKLIENNGNPNFALFGAAQAGHVDIVKQLLKNKAQLDTAISGAVLGGHQDLIFELISQGGNINLAVYSAMRCRRFQLVNKLIEQGANSHDAVKGALEADCAKDLTVLQQFMTFIDDVDTRKLLVLSAEQENPALLQDKIRLLFESASFLNQFMRKHGYADQDVPGSLSTRIAAQAALMQRAQEEQKTVTEPQQVSGVVLLRQGLFARVPMQQPTLVEPSNQRDSCLIL